MYLHQLEHDKDCLILDQEGVLHLCHITERRECLSQSHEGWFDKQTEQGVEIHLNLCVAHLHTLKSW